MKKITWLLPILLLLIIVGCSKLPEHVQNQVDNIPKQIELAQAKIDSLAIENANILLQSDYNDFLKKYAEREHWTTHVDTAKSTMVHISTTLKNRLDSLVDRNKKEEVKKVEVALLNIDNTIKLAFSQATFAIDRMYFLRDAKKTAPKLVKQATADALALIPKYQSLASVVNDAKITYPVKDTALSFMLAEVTKIYDSTQWSAKEANLQFNTDPDYAILGDACAFVTEVTKNGKMSSQGLFAKYNSDIRTSIKELGISYTRILVDMKMDFAITVKRNSWDNYYDGREPNHVYQPRAVSEDVYTYFTSLDPNTAERIVTGLPGNLRFNVNETMWKALKINPNEGDYASGADDAVYWIENDGAKYFHQYLDVKNGDTSRTGWKAVDEETFEDYRDALGMAILTKPYGMFEDEAIEEATPPGFGFVGDSKYGEWKKDDKGDRFWSFYGRYMFINHMMGWNSGYGYNRYGYNSWYGYRHNYWGSSYYGSTGGAYQYGSRSSRTQSRYANSNYGRRGGFKHQSTSSKVGPMVRSKGPGGGGK